MWQHLDSMVAGRKPQTCCSISHYDACRCATAGVPGGQDVAAPGQHGAGRLHPGQRTQGPLRVRAQHEARHRCALSAPSHSAPSAPFSEKRCRSPLGGCPAQPGCGLPQFPARRPPTRLPVSSASAFASWRPIRHGAGCASSAARLPQVRNGRPHLSTPAPERRTESERGANTT